MKQQQQHPRILRRSKLIVDTTFNTTTKNTKTPDEETPQTITTTKSDADATTVSSTEFSCSSASSSGSFSVSSAWGSSSSELELECDHHSNNNVGVVTFGSVQVREYERIIGDHDDLEDFIWGPPLAIGWRYNENIMDINNNMSIDEYEESKSKMTSDVCCHYCHHCGRIIQQHKKLQPLNGKQRRQILQEQFDTPKKEIDNYIRKQFSKRFETVGWVMHIDMFFAKLFMPVEDTNNTTTTTTTCCKRCQQRQRNIVKQKEPTTKTKSCSFLFC